MKIIDSEIKQFKTPYQSTLDFEKFLIKNNVFNNKTKNILDAGCGSGANLNYFSKKNKDKNFFGWDYSKQQIKLAKYYNKDIKNNLFVKDLLKVNNSNVKFDLIYSIHTFCVFKKIEQAIRSISKLKSNWIAINSLFYNDQLDVLIHIRDLNNKKISDVNPDADFNIHSLPQTKKIFKKYGYKVVKTYQYFPKKKIFSKKKGRGSYTINSEFNKNTTFSGPVFLPWHFLLAKKIR